MKLADEVEDVFVRHLAENDRRKAMKYLKPTHRKESHTVTFFIGEYLSCINLASLGFTFMYYFCYECIDLDHSSKKSVSRYCSTQRTYNLCNQNIVFGHYPHKVDNI